MMRLAQFLVAVLLALVLAGSGAAQGVADLVDRARPAVAIVVARTGSGLGQGSGFVYDARGFLLTAAHVVKGADEVMVRLPNRRPMVAVVAQTSHSLDVAALRVGEEGLPFIPLAAGRPRVGEEIVVFGYPRADLIGFDDLTVTRGIVSRLLVDQGLLQFDASVNPGNSGGPVLNGRGEAVGIVVGRIRGAAGINFAILSEAARDVARLALQVPFAPTTLPVPQVWPTPGPSPVPTPTTIPSPGEWRLIGTKGPTPHNTQVRTPVNLAIRAARYRVQGGVLHLQIELYDRPTGHARIDVHWRLPGSQFPTWLLEYHVASLRVVYGRYAFDERRREYRANPVSVSDVWVSITGSFVDVSVPVAALQPYSPEWEIQVATAYLAPDNIYRWVDWLPRTRIHL